MCSSKSGDECGCDLSAIPWEHTFITKVGTGRFIEPCQNKEQLMEYKRPFQEPRRPHVVE